MDELLNKYVQRDADLEAYKKETARIEKEYFEGKKRAIKIEFTFYGAALFILICAAYLQTI